MVREWNDEGGELMGKGQVSMPRGWGDIVGDKKKFTAEDAEGQEREERGKVFGIQNYRLD